MESDLEKIRRLLENRGLMANANDAGVSSAGPFTTVLFRRGSLEIGLIVRGVSLGCPNYSDGGGYVGHDDLVWALGRSGEEQLVATEGLEYRARDGGDAFDALHADLEHIVLPALDASEEAFRRALASARDHLRQSRGW